MKFVAAVCSIIVTFAVVQGSFAQSNNFEWGSRKSGDRLLLNQIITRKSLSSQIVSKPLAYSGEARITYIKVTDQYTDGTGGFANLVKFGVGHTDAIIQFKSQRNHGFNFIVEIFGQ